MILVITYFLMNSRTPVTICLILSVVFSMYFAGVAEGLLVNSVGPRLTFYQLGADGKMATAYVNVFSAGQEIWAGIPSQVSPPYFLTASDSNGVALWTHLANSSPSDNLIPLSLSPSLFHPSQSYQIAIKAQVKTSPGFSASQTYSATLSVVPSFAQLVLKTYTHQNGMDQAQVALQDGNNNPTVGVRLGLTLVQGGSILHVTTETTDSAGKATFSVGQALAAGRYQYEVTVLDNGVWATPVHLSQFTIGKRPTSLATLAINGNIETTLLDSNNGTAVPGRLLVLEGELKDGNWTIISTAYTDDSGQGMFASPASAWRVSFNGDTFYGASLADATSRNVSLSPSIASFNSAGSTLSSPASSNASPSPSGGCNPACCLAPTPQTTIITSDARSSGGISPNCGGGGGGPTATTTTLYLPSSAYATIPVAVQAQVKDSFSNPVAFVPVNFYKDGSSIGSATTNTTGYASLVWTPGVTGSHVINATFTGNSSYLASSSKQSFTISQTPTTTQILNPQPIAFSWDLYNYYSRNGLPIVVPVNILSLALSGNGAPANIYMPAYGGSSTTPAPQTGYGWAGLNQTSAVTVTFNSTYTKMQSLNWTRNFYLPPCPILSNCSTLPRTGHMYLTASLSPPSTLYSNSSTSLTIPYQNVNSLSSAPVLPLYVDGSAQNFCGRNTNSCVAYLITQHNKDIIIVYTVVALDLQSSCTFSVSDTAGLIWTTRSIASPILFRDGNRAQIQEFWARSWLTLSNDILTESIWGCASLQYGGEYNGLMVFGITGTNFDSPFDPAFLPNTASGTSTGASVTISTIYPNDMIIGGIWQGASAIPPGLTPGIGFTGITVNQGAAMGAEYTNTNTALNNALVSFGDTNSSDWVLVGDAVQARKATVQTAAPPSHLYVNVNATYPYISVTMQDLPVALAAYTSYLAYSLGNPLSSKTQGNSTIYALPVPADFGQVCFDSACSSPAANVAVYLYNGMGQYCNVSSVTNNRGIASLDITGPKSTCTFPYSSAAVYTSGTTLRLTELFQTVTISNPAPFYTNFQGYNYAIYAPQRTGRYLLDMYTAFLNSSYTILYPGASYPDVQYLSLSCCDVIFNVEKHPIQAQTAFNPGTATILDKTNATITLNDLATNRPMANTSFNYTLGRTSPVSSIVLSGTLTTNSTGVALLKIGALPYGNYNLTVTMASTSSINAVSSSFSLTVYKAKLALIIRPGWIQNATALQPYTFTTSLVNNATGSLIAVAGLTEKVYLWRNEFLGAYSTNFGGNATFSWTPATAGVYGIEVDCASQNYYTSSFVKISVSVARRGLILAPTSSPPNPSTGHSETWIIKAYDMINNATLKSLPISQYVDGSLTATNSTDSTGTTAFRHTFSSTGSHNVTFVSAQNNTYNSATIGGSISILLGTSLALQGGSTIILGLQNSLTATLNDTTGNSLPGKVIQISINGASYQNVTTDGNGHARFSWHPGNTGGYIISASFAALSPGDSNYGASSNDLTVNVIPQQVTNTQSINGGTESVTFTTAQGSQIVTPPSISFQFPSLGSILAQSPI